MVECGAKGGEGGEEGRFGFVVMIEEGDGVKRERRRRRRRRGGSVVVGAACGSTKAFAKGVNGIDKCFGVLRQGSGRFGFDGLRGLRCHCDD